MSPKHVVWFIDFDDIIEIVKIRLSCLSELVNYNTTCQSNIHATVYSQLPKFETVNESIYNYIPKWVYQSWELTIEQEPINSDLD